MKRLLLAGGLWLETVLMVALATIIVHRTLPANAGELVWALGVMAILVGAAAFLAPIGMLQRLTLQGALIGGACLFILPFFWLVGTSFKYNREIFVQPPHWLPALPRAVVRSPYLVKRYVRVPPPPHVSKARWRAIDSALEQTLWRRARPLLHQKQLALIGIRPARAVLGPMLVHRLQKFEPSQFWNQPIATICQKAVVAMTAGRVRVAWERAYRGLELSGITLTDTHYHDEAVQPADIHWSVSPPANLVRGQPCLVSYNFTHGRAFTIQARFRLPQSVHHLLGITIPIHEDRSWQHVRVSLVVGTERYISRNMMFLGNRRWQSLIFHLHDRDPANETNMGIFPLYRRGKVTSKESPLRGAVQLRLHVTKISLLAATFYKFTDSYRQAWYASRHWLDYLINSVTVVVLCVIFQVISCSMAGYAFARLTWPLRDKIFALLLATMMLPGTVTMIPVFLIFKHLGWYNTLLPLWVPAIFGSAFFIFLLRQFMRNIPRELEEAALMDGCGWFGIYWRIIMPLMKPALAAIAIFTFMGVWNDFMTPLIYLSSPTRYTLPLGMYEFSSAHGGEFGMMMAAATMMTLPVVAVFFVAQRYFIQGITLTGMKG